MASSSCLDWAKILFPLPQVELKLILELVLMFSSAVLATACEIQTNIPFAKELYLWHNIPTILCEESGTEHLTLRPYLNQSLVRKKPQPVNTLWYSSPAACYRGRQIHPCYKSKPFVFSFCFPFSFLPLLYDQYGLSLGNIIRAVTAASNIIIHRVAGSIRTSRIN